VKISVIQKIVKEDLAKFGKLEAWVEPLLESINEGIEAFASALNGRLTFLDNFHQKTVEITFTSGTEKEIAIPANKRVVGVLVLEALNKIITEHGFTRKTNGNIGITISWTGGGDATCRVVILFQ
jgi:hypothetical protein